MNSSDNKPKPHRFQPLPPHKKVFDVIPPGKSPAAPTSRPVVTGQGAQAADQQFIGGKSAPLDGGKRPERPQADGQRQPAESPAAPAKEVQNEQAVPKLPEQETTSPHNVVMLSQLSARAPEIEVPGELAAVESPRPNEQEADTEADSQPQEPQTTPEEAVTHTEVSAVQHSVMHATAVQKTAKSSPSEAEHRPKGSGKAAHLSHDELVQRTNAPDFYQQDAVVSHHRHRLKIWQFLLMLLLIVALALAAFNFLLDAEIIKTDLNLPHTNLLHK